MDKPIVNFIEMLVHNYAKFDKREKKYELELSYIPRHDLYELISLIMLHDPAKASEATGPDNPDYETIMLPALRDHLNNFTDRDNEIEFCTVWRNCILEYLKRYFEELLDEALGFYNMEHASCYQE